MRYEFPHWCALDKDLEARLKRLKQNSGELGSEPLLRANSFQLAATDIFVEKAQIHLTKRARLNAACGVIFASLCALTVATIVYVVSKFNALDYVASWQHVVVFALRGAAIAGFVGGGVYFLASLSRAFFHESTTLYNRRHALRFGRMFIYLKYGESKKDRDLLVEAIEALRRTTEDQPNTHAAHSPSTAHEENAAAKRGTAYEHLLSHLIHRDVSAEELEKAFGWNLETYTGFRDINPEKMSASVYSKTIEVLGKMVESLVKLKGGSKGSE